MASLSEGAFAECEYLPRRNRQDQRFPCAGYECKKTRLRSHRSRTARCPRGFCAWPMTS